VASVRIMDKYLPDFLAFIEDANEEDKSKVTPECVGILKFSSLGMSMLYLVTVLFSSFLVYMVAIFVVILHSFVTLHHHKLVHSHLGIDFPHKQVNAQQGY